MKTIDFILPSYYASAFVNGDYSGLSDEEEEMISDFINANITKYGRFYCIDVDVDNTYFARHNDLTGMSHLGSDVCRYTFDIE